MGLGRRLISRISAELGIILILNNKFIIIAGGCSRDDANDQRQDQKKGNSFFIKNLLEIK